MDWELVFKIVATVAIVVLTVGTLWAIHDSTNSYPKDPGGTGY